MPKTVHKIRKTINYFLFLCITTSILLLAASNIRTYSLSKRVLGASTESVKTSDSTINFWVNFLNKNPNYIPGWVAIGDITAANKIDPNWTQDNYSSQNK